MKLLFLQPMLEPDTRLVHPIPPCSPLSARIAMNNPGGQKERSSHPQPYSRVLHALGLVFRSSRAGMFAHRATLPIQRSVPPLVFDSESIQGRRFPSDAVLARPTSEDVIDHRGYSIPSLVAGCYDSTHEGPFQEDSARGLRLSSYCGTHSMSEKMVSCLHLGPRWPGFELCDQSEI